MSLMGKLKYRKPVPLKGRRESRSGRRGAEIENSNQSENDESTSSIRLSEAHFRDDLDYNLNLFKQTMGKSFDLIYREFKIQLNERDIACALLYLEGTTSKSDINQILHALLMDVDESRQTGVYPFETIVSQCIPYADVSVLDSPNASADWLLVGNSLLLLDGFDQVIGLNTRAFKERSIQPPGTEQVIQGPREGFVESVGTNVSLIRKRLRSANLVFKQVELGVRTSTTVVYCYDSGIVNEELVKEVERRLNLVNSDALYGSGYLEQYIEDNHYSPFPQVQNTERPDKAVAALLEGRVVILVDGSPFALIVPAVFSQFYQAVEDYDTRFQMASMTRGIRLVALLFSLVFPSLYVSLISYNPEMIPTKFAVAVAGGRAGIPFPSIAEIFGLELVMEILREATVRLPEQIGGALSIVGVLVIGEAAVQAGFVSPIAVVIVAMTTIGSFATPAYNAAIALRMLRFPLMILAGIFGLYGVMVGIILICNHLNSLKSFGVPYLSPVVPADASGLKDTVIRAPVWDMKKRPKQLLPDNQTRVGVGLENLQANTASPLDPKTQQSQQKGTQQGRQQGQKQGRQQGQQSGKQQVQQGQRLQQTQQGTKQQNGNSGPSGAQQ
jgi:hypothetical protein